MTPLNSDEIETQSNVSAETIAERSAGDSADERAVIDGGTARCCWQGETMGYGLAAQAIPYADHADELARTPHRDTL